MNEKIIGIDFGDTSVSVVMMAGGKGERRIEAAVQIPLSDRDVWHCLSEAMDAVREKIDINGAGCIVSIPDDHVSYRVIHLPFSDRKKIDKIIRFELEPLLPVPMTDVIVDYYVSAPPSAGNVQTTVFVAAVLKAALKEYLEGLASFDLEPDVVVPRGYATAAVLAGEVSRALVVEKNGGRAFFSFISDNRVQLIRTVNLPREADNLASFLCARLRHTILACQEICRIDFDSQPVFVAGPGWLSEEITGAIGNHLNVPVKQVEIGVKEGLPGNGWVNGFSPGRSESGNGQAQMALSLALLKQARRPGLNFRQGEFAVSGKWRQYSGALVKTALLGVLVLVLGLSGLFYERQRLKKQIALLDARIVGVFQECCPHIPEIVDPLPQLRAELERIKGGSGLSGDMTRKAYVIDVLNDISRLVPTDTDVVVTRLVVGPEEVMMSGNTDAFNAVDTIKSRLGESGFFGKVDISSATMNRLDQRVHFNIRVTLL